MADSANPAEQRRSVERFFDLSLELLAIMDTDGTFVTVNPAWNKVLGWSTAALVGSSLLTHAHPDDVDETLAQIATLRAGPTTVSFVSRYQHRDGGDRQLRWSMTSDDKNLIFVAARDVTKYRVALAEARDNDELWRAVLRTAVDPIVLIDETGKMLRTNEATTTLFGYTRDELVGENVSKLMPEPYRSEHDGYLERYLTTGKARIIGIGREVEAQRADGSSFPMALAVSEVQAASGRLFTGVIHDLSDRRAAEKLLVESNEALETRVRARTVELERSNRDLQQFAYIASHDLRSPLRNVRQGLELLDEHLTETVGSGFDEEASELRDLVTGAVLRMEDLIEGLLSYSQVKRQGRPLTELVDLASVARDVVAQLRLELDDANATVSTGSMPTLHGDEVQLRQLLQNLIQNAVKYRSPDRPPEIAITATKSDDHWLLSVADNGIGISEQQHGRIFELFRRAHSGYDGVGLGLAICQRIVERHGGEIWVTSEPGQGATFQFTLPGSPDGST